MSCRQGVNAIESFDIWYLRSHRPLLHRVVGLAHHPTKIRIDDLTDITYEVLIHPWCNRVNRDAWPFLAEVCRPQRRHKLPKIGNIDSCTFTLKNKREAAAGQLCFFPIWVGDACCPAKHDPTDIIRGERAERYVAQSRSTRWRRGLTSRATA